MSLSELRDGNLFHRSPAQATRERAIVDDTSVANMDSMVVETGTRRNEVRAQRWFFVFGEEPVIPAKPSRQASLVHIVSNLLASWDTAEIRATPSGRGLTGVVRECDFPAE